jgi:hypothetical protein
MEHGVTAVPGRYDAGAEMVVEKHQNSTKQKTVNVP